MLRFYPFGTEQMNCLLYFKALFSGRECWKPRELCRYWLTVDFHDICWSRSGRKHLNCFCLRLQIMNLWKALSWALPYIMCALLLSGFLPITSRISCYYSSKWLFCFLNTQIKKLTFTPVLKDIKLRLECLHVVLTVLAFIHIGRTKK
jgi:hypothetical protein